MISGAFLYCGIVWCVIAGIANISVQLLNSYNSKNNLHLQSTENSGKQPAEFTRDTF